MSLKAKIEAVIYASEDPVTLAQLIGLLGHEGQQELDHQRTAQQNLDLESPEDAAEQQQDATELAEPMPHAAPEFPEFAGPADADANQPEPYAVAEMTGEIAQEEGPTAPGLAAITDATSLPTPRQQERALREYFRTILDELIRDYVTGDRGLEVREVAGGFRLATKPEYHDAVRGFVKSLKPPLKLTLQALETLAVVAYKQPITAPEISEIRGVDSGGVLGSLMARKLITTAGRKQVIGRPILYKTTRDFLLRFGLKDVSELPSIEEFEKMAGDLAEAEPLQEEIQMPAETTQELIANKEGAANEDFVQEQNEHEAQADGDPNGEDAEPVPSADVDGRESSVPPNYEADTKDDPSAQEAEIQSHGG